MKLTGRSVTVRRSTIVFGDEGLLFFGKLTREYVKQGRRIFLLVDANTEKHCLPRLLNTVTEFMPDHILVTEAGEEHKTLANASEIWQELAALGADRHSVLVSLGGGVVTDLGGFAASSFKRGIRCVHIPTTLIGMADAAIGGKTGIDLDGVKNQVGTFHPPDAVIIHPGFLVTLDKEHLRSGMAEVAKSALIGDRQFWNRLRAKGLNFQANLPASDPSWTQIVRTAAAIKHRVVRKDPEEKRERKLLNFGHTVGHAFESLMLRKGTPVSHGAAVAMGMACASWLSVKLAGLEPAACDAIDTWITAGYGSFPVAEDDIPRLLDLMAGDKKNRDGELRFTLISAPGRGLVNCHVSYRMAEESLRWYQAKADLP